MLNSLNVSLPINGRSLYEEALKHTTVTSTGSTNLDKLLDGGLWTGEILEITGPPGCGKTQFWLTAAANLLSETPNSLFVIDPNGSFVCERLLEIITQRKASSTTQFLQDCLARVKYLNGSDAISVLSELHRIEQEMAAKKCSFYCKMNLLVLDTITSLISPILGGGQTQGHMIMVELGRALKRLAADYNIAVIVINNVVLDRDSALEYKPALGKSWRMMPHSRLHLDASKNTIGIAKRFRGMLTKSNKKETGETALFGINESGLVGSE